MSTPLLWLSPSLSLDSRHSSPPSPCNEAKLGVQACLMLGLARLGGGRASRPTKRCRLRGLPLQGVFSSLSSIGFRPNGFSFRCGHSYSEAIRSCAIFSHPPAPLFFFFLFCTYRISSISGLCYLLFPPCARSLHTRL